MTKLLVLMLSSTLLLLTACGDDVSDPTKLMPLAHKVTVTIALNGSPETMIGSVGLDMVLPEGFVLETDSMGQPTGSALSFLVNGAMADVNYISNTGELNAAIIKTEGFAGDTALMQISCIYPANAIIPTKNDFIVNAVTYDADPQNPKAIDISEKISISIELAP